MWGIVFTIYSPHAQTVRRAKPRRESYVYMYPSASLGVQPLGSARGATPRLRSGCNLKEIPIVLRNVVFTPISLHILPHVCI
jgi:hypothetical protein